MINFDPSPNMNMLQQIQEKQSNLMEKLASGKKINSAADGAAAQQIIDRLTSQVEGNRQAINNVYDGISLSQVAEGGVSNINDDVQRIRELGMQAGNGILNDADRKAIQSEITQLQDNIKQTTEQTNFAGKPLLNSDNDNAFQVGANSGQTINVRSQDISARLSDVLSIDVSTQAGATAALDSTDAALENLNEYRAELGATQNMLEGTARSLGKADVNAAEARSRIQDTDYAQVASDAAANDIRGQAALTVQAQANQQQGQVLALLS
ncbi:flagellin [Alteromonas ponticola]|uniref:Flagellin n=1 Tax=Alteromonas aquimaris TaxID=2998417 RepID=A0ABT3P4C3_9ALTE|nr:flagellin [Alteromonas aquimaris]MCW8107617.1 flagellin [Alteromonas aquimaris]